MPQLTRVRVIWTGGAGLPGLSTFYCAGDFSGPMRTAVNGFINAIQPIIPSGVSLNIDTVVDLLDTATGSLVSSTAVAPAGITGTGAATYAAGVGACISWRTADVVAGHRVRGRTFVAPISTTQYDSTGTLTSADLTVLQGAAANLITTGALVVWHRPTVASPAGGSSHVVTAGVIADQVSALRSRRS